MNTILQYGNRHACGALRFARWMWWLVAFFALPASVARADLTYSKIDAATVRVFAYNGVRVERLKARSGHAFVLAVPDAGHGTGLLVGRDGLVLTARHVIEDAQMLAVQLPGEQRPLPARVVYSDEEHDHAFLAIPGKYKDFAEIPEEGQKLAVRDTVYVVGYPLDASRDRPQSQQGIVSGVLADGSLQLGIALNPGNSGGPVVDAKERLLGIAVARADPRTGAQGIGIAVPVDHILPGYKRALASDELKAARKDLAKNEKRLQRDAELLVTLLTSDEANSSFRALSGERDAPASGRVVAKYLEGEKEPSADALSLAAAELWNEAAVHMDQGKSGEDQLSRARDLAQRATSLDSDVTKRSPFVSFLLENNEPTDVAAQLPGGATEEDAEEEGQTDFDILMNSLETSKSLPTLRIGPTIGITTPFQIIGIGVVAKLSLADLFSIQARYNYGWHVSDEDFKGSHLLEGLAGIHVSKWNDTTTAQLIVDVERNWNTTTFHYVPGKIPTVHVITAEAGLWSGPVNLHPDLTALPTAPFEKVQQIYVIEAGIRYTYFYQAKSEYLATNARSTVELSAHLLAPPLGIPDDHNNADDEPIKTLPGAKADIAWGSAPLAWGLTEIGAGYFPSGDWIYLRFGWTYLFY